MLAGSRAFRCSSLPPVNSGNGIQGASSGRSQIPAVINSRFGKLPLQSLPDALKYGEIRSLQAERFILNKNMYICNGI